MQPKQNKIANKCDSFSLAPASLFLLKWFLDCKMVQTEAQWATIKRKAKSKVDAMHRTKLQCSGMEVGQANQGTSIRENTKQFFVS